MLDRISLPVTIKNNECNLKTRNIWLPKEKMGEGVGTRKTPSSEKVPL